MRNTKARNDESPKQIVDFFWFSPFSRFRDYFFLGFGSSELGASTAAAGNVYHCFCFHLEEEVPLQQENPIERFSYPFKISPITSQLYSATSLTPSLTRVYL